MSNGLRRAGSALAIAACLAVAGPALSQDGGWIGVWSASPQPDWGPDFFAPVGIPRSLRDQTIRQVARVSLGGEQVRIELSNEYGDLPTKPECQTVGSTTTCALGASFTICSDTSRAIINASSGTRMNKIDNDHCKERPELDGLEDYIDQIANTAAWIRE